MDRLSHHVQEAHTPRISDPKLKAMLARAAMAHMPGSESLIAKHYESKPVPREIAPPKVQNQVMHTGWIEN